MISIFFILFSYFFLFIASNQQIINNPIKTNKDFNPINYIIIYESNEVHIKINNSTLILTVKKDFKKLFHNSFIFSQSLELCENKLNDIFLFVNEKYYLAKRESEINIKTISIIGELDPNFKYFGYTSALNPKNHNTNNNNLDLKNEIIIYGKLNQKMNFFFIQNEIISIYDFEYKDEQISCKYLNNYYIICTFSEDNTIQILLILFIKFYVLKREILIK